MEKCPGLYCGRTLLQNDSWSACGACPRGFRTAIDSQCMPCENPLSYYDWMYLGFMALLPLIMHWFFIDMAAKERSFSKEELILHVSATFEVIVSALLTVLFAEPIWSFRVHFCGVHRLYDWYTLFHNPTPNYGEKLHCTQEAVYPLQTIVLVFYFFCVLLMMTLRPAFNRKFLKNGKSAVYCALYFFPILSLIHAVAGGLVYYAFPYLSVIISMVSNAAHFSFKLDQSMKALVKSSVTETKNAVIIFAHWMLLAFGIISLQQHFGLLALVPVPAFFYIITVKFTDPIEFRDRDERNN